MRVLFSLRAPAINSASESPKFLPANILSYFSYLLNLSFLEVSSTLRASAMNFTSIFSRACSAL
jgi:hypothetical protein